MADMGSAHLDAAAAESPSDWFSRLSRRSHCHWSDLAAPREPRVSSPPCPVLRSPVC